MTYEGVIIAVPFGIGMVVRIIATMIAAYILWNLN
jgi:hypothetical protein